MSRAGKVIRYASGATGVDFEKWLTWGAIGAGLYLAWKTYSGLSAAADVLANTGSAIGSGLYDFFHPDAVGETLFYTVNFPDGSRHSVPSSVVAGDGWFRNAHLTPNYAGDGRTYRIVKRKGTAMLYAVPA